MPFRRRPRIGAEIGFPSINPPMEEGSGNPRFVGSIYAE